MRLFLRRFPAFGGLQLFALVCGALAGAESVHADTLTVIAGVGSLRDAIAAAGVGDTIQFATALTGRQQASALPHSIPECEDASAMCSTD